MKQSLETDKACIEKIIKYINDIEECFKHFDISTYTDLDNSRLAQLAITQTVTNIYEVKKHIRQITLDKLIEFDNIKLYVARNIASHDYESVNFKIIYDICEKLTSIKINEVLNNEYNNLRQ